MIVDTIFKEDLDNLKETFVATSSKQRERLKYYQH